MSFSRTWQRKTQTTSEDPTIHLWDMGDEQWELTLSTGEIRHWRIVSKEILSREPAVVQELCLLLPECPVSKGAVLQHPVQGWVIDEKAVEQLKLEQLVSMPLISLNNTKKEVKNNQHEQRPPPSSNQVDREQHQLSNRESQVKAVLPPSCTLPMELWSSLSQWIPPSALFQPSLHLQAASELSEVPHRPSGVQRAHGPYSHTGPIRHPHGVRYPRTMHGIPKHVSREIPIHNEVQRSLFV